MAQRSVQLVLDFDGTLTTKDTLHLVAGAGYERQKARPTAQNLPPWPQIVDAYMTDYKAHIAGFSPIRDNRTTLLEETAWLDSLHNVEQASADRVISAGIFDGLTKHDVETAATNALTSGNVVLRPGWAELLATAHGINMTVSPEASRRGLMQIVSVSWSRWFVWSVMWKAATSLEDKILAAPVKDALKNAAVYVNEIESILSEADSTSAKKASPGGQAVTLRTAGDKLKRLLSNTSARKSHPETLTVYVGDSVTDLECLVMADVGICIRDHQMSSGQEELQSTCERIGIQLRSLDQYEEVHEAVTSFEELQKLPSGSITVYYVSDLHEVVDWLESRSDAE